MDLIQDSGEISSQSEKDLKDSGEATINQNKEVTEEATEKNYPLKKIIMMMNLKLFMMSLIQEKKDGQFRI